MKNAILGIDLQFDFCNSKGALYVKGAAADAKNISAFINRAIESIDAIIMSMDSHQPIHIAHQVYWKNQFGETPDLYQTITKQDVINKKWIPQYNVDVALDYLTKLESQGEACTIWPPHCIIGTKGWSIDENVFEAIERWSMATGISYQLVNKGMYQATEHYSIFKAAVEYFAVKSTLFNDALVDNLKQFDKIFIVGEAADFCVASSLQDLLQHSPEIGAKIFMLTDCMSYIVEDSEIAKKIFDEAKELGVTFCKSIEIRI